MPTTRAESPFLTKQSIGGLARLNQASRYDAGGFPIQQLYMAGNNGNPSFKSSQSFIVDYTRALREIGILRSRLGTADVRPRRQYGQNVITSVFQYYKDFIPNDYVARLRQPGQPQGGLLTTSAALRSEAEAEVQNIIDDLTDRIMRTWELQSVAMMTSPVNANITIDGNVVPVPTRLDAATLSSANWNLPGTDIPADIGRFQRIHEQRSGKPTTHVIHSHRLRDSLALNTALRSFVDNNANRQRPITQLPLDMFDSVLNQAVLLEHRQFYSTESVPKSGVFDTQNFYWPLSTMVFLSLQDPRNTIDMATTPTALDQYAGGLFVNRWRNQETAEEWTGVGANAVPYNMDGSCITVFDLQIP
jgi:hypothetical protein